MSEPERAPEAPRLFSDEVLAEATALLREDLERRRGTATPVVPMEEVAKIVLSAPRVRAEVEAARLIRESDEATRQTAAQWFSRMFDAEAERDRLAAALAEARDEADERWREGIALAAALAEAQGRIKRALGVCDAQQPLRSTLVPVWAIREALAAALAGDGQPGRAVVEDRAGVVEPAPAPAAAPGEQEPGD